MMGIGAVEAVVLAAMLSVDAFLASLSYSAGRIRIPAGSMLIISLISSGTLGVSLIFGGWLRPFLPPALSTVFCFLVLFLLGLNRILDEAARTLIRKKSNLEKNLHFSFFHLRFILSVYADPETADSDCSKSLSAREACSLAAALSLDGLAAGAGAALGEIPAQFAILSSFFLCIGAVFLGERLGKRVSEKQTFPVSWISGAVLIGLAVLKLFG